MPPGYIRSHILQHLGFYPLLIGENAQNDFQTLWSIVIGNQTRVRYPISTLRSIRCCWILTLMYSPITSHSFILQRAVRQKPATDHSLVYSFQSALQQNQRKTSLALGVRDVLPNSIPLTVLVGCTCPERLPPLGSYYDFLNSDFSSIKKCKFNGLSLYALYLIPSQK